MLFEVEGVVGMFLDDFEDLHRLGDDLDVCVSRRIGKVRRLLLPLGRHRHLYGISAQLYGLGNMAYRQGQQYCGQS